MTRQSKRVPPTCRPSKSALRPARPARLPARLVSGLVVLVAVFPATVHPCSLIHPGIDSLHLGQDGLLHWKASPPPGVLGGPYWFTEGAGEPEPRRIVAPAIREGQTRLMHVLPDGSSWWNVGCTDWEAPKTAACDSWVWIDAEGQPLGRVAAGLRGHRTYHLDGTIELLDLREHPEVAKSRDKHDRGPARHVLELWRATPQPLASFDEPLPPGRWHEDHDVRQERARSDGWSREWRFDFPRLLERHGSSNLTLHGGLLATVHHETAPERGWRGMLRVTVWELKPDSRSEPVRPRWDRTFPWASDGRTRTDDGEFALAEPGYLAFDAHGRLALGGWQTNADCTRDRPPGFVVFDRDGEPIAEVDTRDDHIDRLAGLAFDRSGDIVVFGERDFGGRYDTSGRKLGEVRTRPTIWREEQEQFLALVDGLDAHSSLADWSRTLPYLIFQSFRAEIAEKLAIADSVLARHWPQIDATLDDRTRAHFARTICDAFPRSAPPSFLRRFEEADERTRREWLKVLPDCVVEPPPLVRAYLSELLASRDSDRRRLGEQAAARWPAEADDIERLWRTVRGGLSSPDQTARNEAVQAARSLFAMAPQLEADFAARLHGDDRETATLVLSLGFVHIDQPDWVPDDLRAGRDEVLRWAREWAVLEGGDERLRGLATILAVGHGDEAAGPGALRFAADALASESLWPWAAIAFGRALERSTVKAPGSDWSRPRQHHLDLAGLPRALALRLFERMLQRPVLHWQRDANGLRVLREPPDHASALLAANALDRAERALALSLGDEAKNMLRTRVDELAQNEERDVHLRRRADQLHGLAVQLFDADPEPWSRREIAWLLDRPHPPFGVHRLWNRVAESLPEDHALRQRVEAQFLALLDAAKRSDSAPRGDARAAFNSDAGRFVRMLGELASEVHLGSDSPPSPLFALIDPSDLEAVAFAQSTEEQRRTGRIDLEGWLLAMVEIGPWPEAVPDLERRLAGLRPFMASLALSHLRHPGALDHLIETNEGSESSVDRALARYGPAVVDRLAEVVLDRFDAVERARDAGPPSSFDGDRDEIAHYEWKLEQAVGRLARRLDGFARAGSERPKSARLDEVEQRALVSVRADLEKRHWPTSGTVLLLDVLDHDAFAWLLSAAPELPAGTEQEEFFTGVCSDLLFQRLERRSRTLDPAQREILESQLLTLVEEWGDTPRWLLRSLRATDRRVR